MELTLQYYRQVIDEQPHCDTEFLQTHLARYRAGDDEAARLLAGSCLRLALDIADQRANLGDRVPFLDLVQEANGGLMEAITSFQGNELDDFLDHARRQIERRLTALS